jgi:acetoacetate decarboxylase
MLKVVYRTDPEKIAALLPPGIEPGKNPHVTLTFYNFPVPDEPEYGILQTVDAIYDGIEGEYAIGYGIDQESAIFGSQEFKGASTGPTEPLEDFDLHEWWIKASRAVSVGGPATGFDFPPHVVHVRSRYGTAWREEVQGELLLRDSPWDPLASELPLVEQVSAHLWWPIFLDREIKLAGPLDPEGFLPFADTISGSRWPGTNGGPKRD